MSDAVVLYTTWPDAETAEAAAAEAIAERLCACANIQAPMTSIYRWEGAIERSSEVPVLFKTTAAKSHALCSFLTGKHPHATPCVLALKPGEEGSNPAFLAWIAAQTA